MRGLPCGNGSGEEAWVPHSSRKLGTTSAQAKGSPSISIRTESAHAARKIPYQARRIAQTARPMSAAARTTNKAASMPWKSQKRLSGW